MEEVVGRNRKVRMIRPVERGEIKFSVEEEKGGCSDKLSNNFSYKMERLAQEA